MKQSSRARFITLLVLAVGFWVGLVYAQSGSLEPPATAVDGSGNPQATTQTQPSWDQDLPADDGDPTTGCNSTRFKCVFPLPFNPSTQAGTAVLDKETGLVWERSPSTTFGDWKNARLSCIRVSVGNQKGWRLPSFYELASLLESTTPEGIPVGHPFSNVITGMLSGYWSATSSADSPTLAWSVTFLDGALVKDAKFQNLHVWCVRGGGILLEY